MKCRLLLALAAVFLVHSSWATIPLYQNQDVLIYTIPGAPPPQIDALAFDNENTFIIHNNTFNPATPYYQTMNTLFYTNTGVMQANTEALFTTLSGLLTLPGQNYGLGFNFDLYNGNSHQWADTFYNPGTIHGVSTLDGNISVFLLLIGNGITAYELTAFGDTEVAATNIINPGTVEVSVNGTIRMTGKNVDLTGGQFIVEPQLNFFGTLGAVNLSSVGAVGTDTNGDWNPGAYLTPTSARSSFVPVGPGILILTNSQCYYDQRSPAANYFINRYVFVENNSPNVPYHVYIDDPLVTQTNLAFAAGAAHVEWVASYTDAASGNTINNYLYLTDDYALGATTNDLIIQGVPLNFSFATSPTPLIPFVPNSQSFAPLPNGFMSNNYACFFGSLAASTVGTNVSFRNPHGTITNLPGKIWITASNELNLAFTTMSGLNYLNLNCTNQFDGSPGAAIAAPFSDISLGVTNGSLTFSNVLMGSIPTWSGTIDAWSSDWFVVDTTVTPNVTNEYKVMLVFSALQPTTPPYTKNLYLHGTNILDVSDPLNVYGSLYSDAKILTLNTNQVGNGATSLDGELNWLNPLPFNANSGNGLQQMPNLLWVTNYGSIRVLETANIGNANVPQFLVVPAVPPVLATGTLSEIGTNAVNGDKVIIGTNKYTFVRTLTNTVANQVQWAALFDASMGNLIAAINGAAGAGTKYSSVTKSNKFAKAGSLVNHAFTVSALNTNSAIGDTIVTLFMPATASSNLTWGGNATLMNGMDYIPPFTNYTSINNHSLISDQGATIWTTYFESDGTVSNGSGSFILHSGMTVLTNGNLVAGGDVVLMATNKPGNGTDSLLISNQMIQAGRKLTLLSTNITDGGLTNGNIWVVGANSGGGSFDSGFNIPWKPPFGDLLGTTLTNIAPFNKDVFNVLAGHDFGISTAGYTNNLALGNLILDVLATNSKVAFTFSGATTNNALYVDLLQLKDGATFGNNTNQYNFPWLQINPGMMVYYAQALENGISVAEAIDVQSQHGANNGRLRWVYSYAGYYSSTNIIYPDGSTNTFNSALAHSTTIDSDSDGTANAFDPTPFFVPSEMHFMASITNMMVKIQWTTIPNATNFVYFATNMMSTNWLPYTNFNNWYYGNNVAVTNSAHVNSFHSPQVYINASGPDNYQQTNVWVYDSITNVPPRYYKVSVSPWLNFPE